MLEYVRKDVLEYVRKDVLEYVRKDVLEYVRKDALEYVRKDVLEYARKDVLEYVRKAQPVKHKQKTKKITFYQKSIDHKKQKLYHTLCQEMKGNTNKLLYAQNAQRTIVTISYESTPYCYVTKYRKIPHWLS